MKDNIENKRIIRRKFSMKKFLKVGILVAMTLIIFTTVSCLSTLNAVASNVLGGSSSSSSKKSAFTNSEAVTAMKDALNEGIKSASSNLSQKNGYFGNAALKILLPPEAQPIMNVVNKIPGGQTLIDDVVLRLNRSAEESAKDVTNIFAQAIKEMTVTDGIKIVTGKNNAATEYLREKTYNKLLDLYKPKVSAALNKPLVLNVSANKAWSTLTTSYNKVGEVPNKVAKLAGKNEPFPEVEVDLATYSTKKALDGLFVKIAEEEKDIRANPLDYASSMIKKVFGAVKSGNY